MTGRRKGPNSKLIKARDLLGSKVMAHFENSNSYIDGRLVFGQNRIIDNKTEFTEQRFVCYFGSDPDSDKSTGYYIVRENEPALRIYLNEIKDIEINENPSLPMITINPDKDKPKSREMGFVPFWLKNIYQQNEYRQEQ